MIRPLICFFATLIMTTRISFRIQWPNQHTTTMVTWPKIDDTSRRMEIQNTKVTCTFSSMKTINWTVIKSCYSFIKKLLFLLFCAVDKYFHSLIVLDVVGVNLSICTAGHRTFDVAVKQFRLKNITLENANITYP